ncbi:tRNA epoxyqueuosine(34) reductase QueG [Thiomicrorhabdus lithotrophica]|uniref:Epoxyqueuosine reductase n=1 Tax=Thiomicrorhabdus lithotrophica TaxID=2949997 RepID=A0ABY8C739_9GAMM|nr:tRNA epoxyqueuosine(34) reductase QueG [Thiomicrorhabdus lithotrophica]WEJ61776.1 tRNA epoxyqueuosine(34) reductase QueG [Thiomicrorhabdus lithotrophica]
MKNASINDNTQNITPESLSLLIKDWGKELGFADIGISDTDLSAYEAQHFNWIGENFHGEMEYMARHGTKRTRPNELEPGTISVISVRMNYFDNDAELATQQLHSPEKAYISRYALGKDYHKLIRKRLQALANKIAEVTDDFSYRAFADSAPVLERPIAEKAGLGFIGKNSLIIHPRAGSWFFLGEIYTNLALPVDKPFTKQGCGPCTACIQECPTQAIVDNAVIDARRCISYLTIEFKGSIPLELRPLMGNRIYGCDDCQLVCPWNKFTDPTHENAFKNQMDLDSATLVELWNWNENQFLKKLEGSPIRRIGFIQWNRNLAVSMGNVEASHAVLEQIINHLQTKLGKVDALVDEHIDWAINQLKSRMDLASQNIETEVTRPDNLMEKEKEKETEKEEHRAKNAIKPFIAKKYYLPK